MVTRLVAKAAFGLVAGALFCLSAHSQTTYHFHKETASTGYDLLSTAGPDSASTTLTTSNLKGKTGSTWIANWATTTGVPNSVGTVLANSTFQFSLWMNKSASFGTIYPVVTVGKLDANQNATSWATATATTALTTTLAKITFSFTLPAAQNMVATDRWWVEVGAYIPSGGSTTHSVTASFAFEGTLNGNYDSTGALPAIVRMPVSLAVSPQNPYVAVGGTQQFTAIGTYSDNTTADLTTTVSWASSSTQVGTITSAGVMTGHAAGTTTISATLGTVNSSATATVTQSALVSISISPPNPSLALGLTTGLSATGHFADGSTQDFTRTVSWTSSQLSVATISSTGETSSRAQGTTTITATLSTFTGSTTLTVTAPALASAVISPGSPFLPPGTSQQLTATGTYSDGSSQDITSSASWSSLASNIATVTSTGMVTAVNTGTATISVSASGLTFFANVNVTAPGPPVIVGSVSPTPNAAGWNNSPVTVTFTCTPGSATITNCPPPQVVTSEGSNQIVTGTVTDSSSNTASVTVTLNIDETPPGLSVSSPTDGATISTATVTTTGSLYDSLSGVSALTCNGTPVTLSGSSFSCNISLQPGLNLIAVRVTDTAGNVALTKMHVTYPVYPAPTSITITPTGVNLAVGQTQQFTATDNQGRPRPDATWSLPRRTTLATITTGSSPILTANAAGQVTLTATVQGISAQTAVNIVTIVGSSNWTVSPLPGLAAGYTSVGHFAPAAPSANGPALYSVEGGSSFALRALTNDGQQLWQQYPLSTTVIGPDPSGGLLVEGTGNGMADFDGQTGSTLWSSNFVGSRVAWRTDGNAVGLGRDAQQPSPPLTLFVVNGATGQSIQVPIPEKSTLISTNTTVGCGGNQNNVSDVGTSNTVITDPDGNAYFEYVVSNTNATVVNTPGFCDEAGFSETIKNKLVLMTVFADGSTSTSQLASRIYTQTGTGGPGSSWGGSFLSPGSANPDGQGGVLATWSETFVDLPSYYMVSHISASGQTDSRFTALDGTNPLGPSNNLSGTVVLDSGGNGYVTSGTGSGSYTVVAFDTNSGQIIWTAQPGYVGYMFAQDGGGVIFQSYDASGNPVVKSIDSMGNLGPSFSTGIIQTDTWGGNWFSVGPGVSAINLPFVVDQASYWPESLGNPSQSNFSVPGCPCLNQTTNSTLPSSPQAADMTTENMTVPDTQATDESAPLTQLSGPSNCPICNLPQPPPSQCVTMQGAGAVYLILVGDPGLGGHNLNDLFNLAAQQKANDLNAAGNKVIACRISSVNDFHTQLTGNGLITGGVFYFGHSGPFEFRDAVTHQLLGTASILAAGQTSATGSNIEADNVQQLCDPNGGCNINNYLAPSSTVTIVGCRAAENIDDFLAQKTTSIAKLIAKQLARPVYGWKIGMYASQQDRYHDQLFAPTKQTKNPPDSLPMYFVPIGRPGAKPGPLICQSGGSCSVAASSPY